MHLSIDACVPKSLLTFCLAPILGYLIGNSVGELLAGLCFCKYITLTSEGTQRGPERHVPEIPPQGDFCPREKGVSALAGF